VKKKTDKNPLNAISIVYFLKPLVYREVFTDDYYPSGYFSRTGTMADSGSPWVNTIASCERFKPILCIRIIENLVVNYNV